MWSIAEGGAIHRVGINKDNITSTTNVILQDGRLEVGDQLLRVDDQSLMNCSQQE